MARGTLIAARRRYVVIVLAVLLQVLGLQPALATGDSHPATAGTAPAGSTFFPVGPVRVMDTRNGTGGTTGPVAGGSTVVLQLAGVGGVPSSGATAVVLNLSVTAPTESGYVEAYPDGESAPVISDVDFTAGQTLANMVTVPLGSDGKIDFKVAASGTVQLLADLSGYYYGAPDSPGSVTAVPGNGQAIVSWTAPDSAGASSLTGYTVTASPGGATASTTGQVTAATVTGLTNGTAYTFRAARRLEDRSTSSLGLNKRRSTLRMS
jgi:Fibronectin type III domain